MIKIINNPIPNVTTSESFTQTNQLTNQSNSTLKFGIFDTSLFDSAYFDLNGEQSINPKVVITPIPKVTTTEQFSQANVVTMGNIKTKVVRL